MKPVTLIGVGDTRIDDWIKQYFLDQLEIIVASSDPEDIKKKILEVSPQIFILMRGIIPQVDSLALWASEHVPEVLFIVGDLDDVGISMVNKAREAGIKHIITCEKGGQIYGDELVYVLTSIIKELQGSSSSSLELEENISSLNLGTGKIKKSLSGMLGMVKNKPTDFGADSVVHEVKKKLKPRINMSDGISLEEINQSQAIIQNSDNLTSIVPGSILAFLTPWRPNLAGRLAAHAVKILGEVEGSEVTYIGASKNSTGALWLDIPDDILMMSDWRLPGSNCPIVKENLRIFAVDPVKDLSPACDNDLWNLLKQARMSATYTVVDCAGDITIAQKAACQGRSVLLVILPGNDPVELKISSLWLRHIMDGKQNVVTGIDLRGVPSAIPENLTPKVVIRNNPADALTMVLRRTSNDEFIWS